MTIPDNENLTGRTDYTLACWECDSTRINRRVRSGKDYDRTPEPWRCLNCGAVFNAPKKRERYESGVPNGGGANHPAGLAGKLLKADADEVGRP